MVKNIILNLSIILFFIMFIYSGIDKILSFDKQVEKLEKKTKLPIAINQLGMIGVIILEIIGSLLIIDYFLFRNTPKLLAKYVLYTFLLFMKITPFLSNITTFAGFLLIYKNI